MDQILSKFGEKYIKYGQYFIYTVTWNAFHFANFHVIQASSTSL